MVDFQDKFYDLIRDQARQNTEFILHIKMLSDKSCDLGGKHEKLSQEIQGIKEIFRNYMEITGKKIDDIIDYCKEHEKNFNDIDDKESLDFHFKEIKNSIDLIRYGLYGIVIALISACSVAWLKISEIMMNLTKGR